MAVNVLLLENIHADAGILFTEAGYNVTSIKGAPEPEELVRLLKGVDILGIRSKTRITREILCQVPQLLAIGCFCIGYNQVDIIAAQELGIPVFNSPFANSRSVAELIIGQIIMLSRKLGERNNEMHSGVWRKESQGCHEIRGKKLGIVGYGHIGSQLSVLAESLGMRVYFYDILPKLSIGNAKAVSSLQELLTKCEYISLHVPETESTKEMINKTTLMSMQKGSYLLNASRGSVVNIKDVVECLKTNRLAGGFFDVFPEEPGSNNEPFASALQGVNNVTLTPHIGGSTEEAQAAIGLKVAERLVGYTNEGTTLDSVNFSDLNPVKLSMGSFRLMNVHKNVPGVIRSINTALTDYNIVRQYLSTKDNIGYTIIDTDTLLTDEVLEHIKALPTSIRTRKM